MDDTDLQIVDLLMEDGRMSSAKIARQIGGGITERVVRYRIDRLLKDQVIQISAIANPRALGYTVTADVVIEVEPSRIQNVAEKIASFENVSYVAYSIGNIDVSVQIVARDTSEVYDFVTSVIGHLPGVRKTATTIVPRVVKDVYQWQIPRPKPDS
jgi:Lrp/AsnC family transcriptional regulator, regulator for asnA, asnC and gidA